ncbi:MAG: hypothetical protein FJ196_06720 [Gammaproteobacteria bacterium]|nr:hypothetical protein [Gammaproteobacteria bacterium]
MSIFDNVVWMPGSICINRSHRRALKRIDYPGAAGGTIPVMFSAVWDADGNFIEMNKILGTPAGVER